MRILFLGAALAALITAVSASSALGFVFRSDDEIYLTDSYEEDLFLIGGSLGIEGAVRGDIFAGAGTININGEVDGSVTAFGQRVTVNGDVRRSLRGAAQFFTINSMVAGDLLVAAQDVFVTSDAVVARDAALAGAKVIIDGTVEGDCELRGGAVTISGRVEGDVHIIAEKITISPPAVIEGDLDYESGARAKIASEAQILGETRFKKQVRSAGSKTDLPLVPPPASWLWSFLFFCGTFVMGLVVILFKRDMVVRVAMDMKARFILHGLLGMLLIIVTPILLVLVAIPPVGWPIAVAGVAVYTLTFIVAKIFVGITLGTVILSLFRGEGRVSLGWSLLLGMLILALLFKIPVFGWLVYLAAWAIGAGAMTFCFFRRKTVIVGGATASAPASEQT